MSLCPCCPSSSASSSSISSSSGFPYCPANEWAAELDASGCSDEEIQAILDSAPREDGVLADSGWSLRALVYEVGVGGSPQTIFAFWQCCNGRPTGPGNPSSSGEDTCDDVFMEDKFNDWITANQFCTGTSAPTGSATGGAVVFFHGYCDTTDSLNDLVPIPPTMAGSRDVELNRGCLNCCGNEQFEEGEEI